MGLSVPSQHITSPVALSVRSIDTTMPRKEISFFLEASKKPEFVTRLLLMLDFVGSSALWLKMVCKSLKKTKLDVGRDETEWPVKAGWLLHSEKMAFTLLFVAIRLFNVADT